MTVQSTSRSPGAIHFPCRDSKGLAAGHIKMVNYLFRRGTAAKRPTITLKTSRFTHTLLMDRDQLGIVITAACLLFLFFAVPMSGLLNNGYVVTPATDTDISNSTPLETVEVSFWDLPPRDMLISVALSLSPLLLYPIEVFFFLKMVAYLGYRKIAAASVLTNATRSRIYETIVANPGIFFNGLARQTGVARSTLSVPSCAAENDGKISASKTVSDVRSFEKFREIFRCRTEDPRVFTQQQGTPYLRGT